MYADMNLKEALAYLTSHENEINQNGQQILGVAYTPDDSCADFYLVELSLDTTEFAENGNFYFNVTVDGGRLNSFEGVEDHFSDENIEALIKQLPEFAQTIQYKVYELEESPFGLESAFALHTIFPTLPDPDDCDTAYFKAEAIKLVSDLNTPIKPLYS